MIFICDTFEYLWNQLEFLDRAGKFELGWTQFCDVLIDALPDEVLHICGFLNDQLFAKLDCILVQEIVDGAIDLVDPGLFDLGLAGEEASHGL